MSFLDWWNLLGNASLVIGVPLAIFSFLWDARRQRKIVGEELQQKQEEIYLRLSDEYVGFLKLLLDHPELRLLSPTPTMHFSAEQEEQRLLIFGILVSLFERAYILVYEDHMDAETKRRWLSWEDYMRDWCRRADFRAALKFHLQGEDEDFRKHIEQIVAEEAR